MNITQHWGCWLFGVTCTWGGGGGGGGSQVEQLAAESRLQHRLPSPPVFMHLQPWSDTTYSYFVSCIFLLSHLDLSSNTLYLYFLPVMSRISPGLTVNTQKAARRHSTTFISTPDWSVTTIDASGTEVPADDPDLTFSLNRRKIKQLFVFWYIFMFYCFLHPRSSDFTVKQ